MNAELKAYFSALGKKGGAVRSAVKQAAALKREANKRQLRASVLIEKSKGAEK